MTAIGPGISTALSSCKPFSFPQTCLTLVTKPRQTRLLRGLEPRATGVSPSARARGRGRLGPGRFGRFPEGQSPGRRPPGSEACPERGNSHGWVLGTPVDSGSGETEPSWRPLCCLQAVAPPGSRQQAFPPVLKGGGSETMSQAESCRELNPRLPGAARKF